MDSWLATFRQRPGMTELTFVNLVACLAPRAAERGPRSCTSRPDERKHPGLGDFIDSDRRLCHGAERQPVRGRVSQHEDAAAPRDHRDFFQESYPQGLFEE
jgi:hypothetical protein